MIFIVLLPAVGRQGPSHCLIISTMPKPNKRPSKQQQKQQKQQQKGLKEKGKGKGKGKEQVESESESSQNADIDLNQVEGGQVEQMEVSFIVGEIQEDYYHSLKTILLRYAQITKTTNAELADALVANKSVGNVVLADDDEEEEDEQQEGEEQEQGEDDEENVYAVLSVLAGKSAMAKKIRAMVLKSIEKKDFPEQVITILKDPTTGVILNERLANLPAFVACSSHEVFKKDMEQLRAREPGRYEQVFGGHLLNVSEVQFEGEEELEKLVYSKFEDYEMCQRARVWWLGATNASHRRKADMRSLYYLITPQQYFAGVDNIKTYLTE